MGRRVFGTERSIPLCLYLLRVERRQYASFIRGQTEFVIIPPCALCGSSSEPGSASASLERQAIEPRCIDVLQHAFSRPCACCRESGYEPIPLLSLTQMNILRLALKCDYGRLVSAGGCPSVCAVGMVARQRTCRGRTLFRNY